MDAFRKRENELRQEDLRLQEFLINFNKFLQENENKRTRAMKQIGMPAYTEMIFADNGISFEVNLIQDVSRTYVYIHHAFASVANS